MLIAQRPTLSEDTVDEFRSAAERAGLPVRALAEHVEAGAPPDALPRLLAIHIAKREAE